MAGFLNEVESQILVCAAQMRSGRERRESQERNRGNHGKPNYAKPESAREGGIGARRSPGDRDSGDSWHHQRASTAGTGPINAETGHNWHLAGQIDGAPGA